MPAPAGSAACDGAGRGGSAPGSGPPTCGACSVALGEPGTGGSVAPRIGGGGGAGAGGVVPAAAMSSGGMGGGGGTGPGAAEPGCPWMSGASALVRCALSPFAICARSAAVDETIGGSGTLARFA